MRKRQNLWSVTHGKSRTKTYKIWTAMKCRCLNPYDERYMDYGGRGITVCKSWLKFENFIADMGEKPNGLTLEREDNNKGYSPKNCVWATPKTQARNKRSSKLTLEDAIKMIELQAQGLTYSELGKLYGIRRDHAWYVVNGRIWLEARQLAGKH